MEGDLWLDIPCKLWKGPFFTNGYGECYKHYRGKLFRYMHRYSWAKANNRLPPKGFEVAHLCQIRNCYEPMHLVLMTHQENMKSAKYGVLSKEDREEIFNLREDGWTYQRIADEFNVHKTTIGRIIKGVTWK